MISFKKFRGQILEDFAAKRLRQELDKGNSVFENSLKVDKAKESKFRKLQVMILHKTNQNIQYFLFPY